MGFFKLISVLHLFPPKCTPCLLFGPGAKCQSARQRKVVFTKALLTLATLSSSQICFIQILLHGRQILVLAACFVEWIKNTALCNAHCRLQVLDSK